MVFSVFHKLTLSFVPLMPLQIWRENNYAEVRETIVVFGIFFVLTHQVFLLKTEAQWINCIWNLLRL